jgi:hypothetical protein
MVFFIRNEIVLIKERVVMFMVKQKKLLFMLIVIALLIMPTSTYAATDISSVKSKSSSYLNLSYSKVFSFSFFHKEKDDQVRDYNHNSTKSWWSWFIPDHNKDWEDDYDDWDGGGNQSSYNLWKKYFCY